ncbi:MAG: hypothetical protein ABJE95_31270 [Byssovorax sp.]
MNPAQPPFQRTDVLDKPGIVGAKWWQEGLATHDPMARRAALVAIAVLGVGMLAVGGLVAAVASVGPSEPDTTTTMFGALDMQRKYGWSFGASSEALTFDGESQQPFEKGALDRMVTELAPAQTRLKRFSSPTLFQSPAAMPTSVAEGDPGQVMPLRDALRPIFTHAMDTAYRTGKALASLFDGAKTDVALVVDLPGPQAIACAAGLAGTFDPCFAFENWPHPRGVVPAHLALAAAAYYQPLFARTAASRKQPGPAALVLDRGRLSSYTDDASQFDNRYAAKLPTAASLKELGVKRVLYVVPTGNDMTELDDLNEQFVAYAGAGLDVKIIAATDFGPDTAAPAPMKAPTAASPDAPIYYYGSSSAAHSSFWPLYRWGTTKDPAVASGVSTGYIYVPRARSTAFSSAAVPTGFGLVPVVIAVGTGAILGAKLSRSGSWNRASSGS